MVSWVRNGTTILVARRTRFAPGKLTHRFCKKPASSTVRQVRTAYSSSEEEGGMADSFRHAKLSHHGMYDVARPHQREATTKAGKVTWPYAEEGSQGAAATSMTAPCALWTAADADAALCAGCFCCRCERSAKELLVTSR